MVNLSQYCGWMGAIQEFLDVAKVDWIAGLKQQHLNALNLPFDQSQVTAWSNCFEVLQDKLPDLMQSSPSAGTWTLIFEYVLPRERGRRPDLVLLTEENIFVLEFKDFSMPLQAHIDQVAAYVRDLSNYQAESHGRKIYPLLVLTKAKNYLEVSDEVIIVSSETLVKEILDRSEQNGNGKIDPDKWVIADYSPLPFLVTAARQIFQHEHLPFIKRAQSAGIPETISQLLAIADLAQTKMENHLALVTGVPGAGKTLVGLQFVYEHFQNQAGRRAAVFLSGNGPLVQVLQHALKSSIFVQDVHNFLVQYGGNRTNSPEENIFIFDEAQRAWDAQRVSEKRGHSASEPEDFLRIGEKKSWSFLIGLVGEGQEIYLGEESGLAQWNTALAKMKKSWVVHCPPKLSNIFASAKRVESTDALNLDMSLRSHIADDLQSWVRALLNSQLSEAQTLSQKIYQQSFDLYLTRNIEAARRYTFARYLSHEDKRFGFLASSKAKVLGKYGVHNEYQYTSNLRVGPWYNDPPGSPNSCCQLKDVATEFACQGLELDFPIICWGDDLTWHNGRWVSPPSGPRSKAINPHQLRLNSYRVLLTRGRDGMIIYVPPESLLDSTYRAFLESGIRELMRS